jgi:hypothetical protein
VIVRSNFVPFLLCIHDFGITLHFRDYRFYSSTREDYRKESSTDKSAYNDTSKTHHTLYIVFNCLGCVVVSFLVCTVVVVLSVLLSSYV